MTTECHRTVTHSFALRPEIGDIWKEIDPRFERYIRITGHDPLGYGGAGGVQFETVYRAPETIGWQRVGRSGYRWAQLKRFNGKRGGYGLHIRSTI